MSDIASAFLNTPVPPESTILVKPPPECEQDNNTLWRLNKQLYGLRITSKVPTTFVSHTATTWTTTTTLRSMCLPQ
eukprot:2448113-Amphidinium_carterae.1